VGAPARGLAPFSAAGCDRFSPYRTVNTRVGSSVHPLDVTAAVSFTWLGMVLAISFLEAPLKFRAPDVTLRVGLGIGRLVFRALNRVELVLLLLVVVAVVITPRTPLLWSTAGLAVLLGLQIGLVRPTLNRRSDRVLAGEELPRSRVHLIYVGLEVVKVILLVASGWLASTT
jgi:hypothetical protein